MKPEDMIKGKAVNIANSLFVCSEEAIMEERRLHRCIEDALQKEIGKLKIVTEQLRTANEILIKEWPTKWVALPNLPNVPWWAPDLGEVPSEVSEVSIKPPQNPASPDPSNQHNAGYHPIVPNRADEDTSQARHAIQKSIDRQKDIDSFLRFYGDVIEASRLDDATVSYIVRSFLHFMDESGGAKKS